MIYVDIFEKAYQFLQDEGIAARRHIELKQYTTLHIAWEEYLKVYSDCKPEDFLSEMQTELDRRIQLAKDNGEY